MFSRAHLVLGTLAVGAMLSLAVLSPRWMLAPVLTQTLTDRNCTGKSDIPDDRQILGCSDAIKSGSFAGKDLAAALSNRGRAYRGKGQFDLALADYDQAIPLDPGSAISFYGRGAAYFFKKDNDQAIDDFTKSVSLDPNDAAAYNGRGNAYAARGDIDRAIAGYGLAISLNPAY